MEPILSGSLASASLVVSLLLIALIVVASITGLAVAGIKPLLRDIRDNQEQLLHELRRRGTEIPRIVSPAAEAPGSRARPLRAERL